MKKTYNVEILQNDSKWKCVGRFKTKRKALVKFACLDGTVRIIMSGKWVNTGLPNQSYVTSKTEG